MNIRKYIKYERSQIQVFFVFDRITMNLFVDTRKNGHLKFRSRDISNYEGTSEEFKEDFKSIRVIHDEPHLLVARRDYHGGTFAYHTNLNGDALVGSNTDENGALCLGDSFSLFDWSAVDLLCNYQANNDYAWRGDGIKVSKTQENEDLTKIDTWPPYKESALSVPRGISELF